MKWLSAAVISVMLVAPAWGNVAGDVAAGDAAQKAKNYAEAIKRYSQAIEWTGVPRGELVRAYVRRADAYRQTGRDTAAIADYGSAIALEPETADAYNGRGLARVKQGLYRSAVADYDQAIGLKPDFAFAYTNRGRAYFHQGLFAKAAESLVARLRIEPKHVYPMLWLYLAREKMGRDGKAELASYAKMLEGDHWIYQVALFYLGEAIPDRVLEAARRDPEHRREREAEAYFYMGAYFLLRGQRRRAEEYFRATLASGLKNFYEYTAAKIELGRRASWK